MIKVAILGTGGIAAAHIEAYLKFPDRCRIVALANTHPEKARALADRYRLKAAVYDDYRAALDGTDIGLASICLPPFLHAPAVLDCLAAGAHVLVEKPMAASLAECDTMIAAAQKAGRLLSVVAQNRFRDDVLKLKGVLDSGLAGRVLHARVDSFWKRGTNYYNLWWRGTWEKEGGGCTLNHAVHHIDLFHWLIGPPVTLQAAAANAAHHNSEVEDFSTAVLFYKNGAVGQINASLLHHGEEQPFVIQGERAMIALPWRVTASRQRADGFPENDPAPAGEIGALYARLPGPAFPGHTGQIDNMLSAIEVRAPLLVDGAAGRDAIEIITAIYYSAFGAGRVTLPLSQNNPYYTREGLLKNAHRFNKKPEKQGP